MNERPLCILPMAGYGTRVGMKPHEAKELLPDPESPKNKLIDYCMDICFDNGCDPVIVTRKGKTELNEHLKSLPVKMIIELDEPVLHEWPTTVLSTKHLWRRKNILILPDTRFSPVDILKWMMTDLDTKDLTIGLHDVDDLSKWGAFDLDNEKLSEKPQTRKGEPGFAWGVLGFRPEVGEFLMKTFETPGVWASIAGYKYELESLHKFEDITREMKK